MLLAKIAPPYSDVNNKGLLAEFDIKIDLSMIPLEFFAIFNAAPWILLVNGYLILYLRSRLLYF